MTAHQHTVVWIDHREAKLFGFGPEDVDKLVIHSDKPTQHIHYKANSIGSGHVKSSESYLHEVAEALAGTQAILITGPSNAKTELLHHLQKHDPQIAKKVSGVETVDHPSDGQLVAHARKYFNVPSLNRPRV
jgi:hypothetical protein